MKTIFFYFFIFYLSFNASSQTVGDIDTLDGYFIVSSFNKNTKCNCNLDIKSTKMVSGDSMICGDGNFYKNISTIKYIRAEDLDLKKIGDTKYQKSLLQNEHYTYLTTNPSILLEGSKGDSTILQNVKLVNNIVQNKITADLIQTQIEKLKLDYTETKHYYILMKVSVKVLILPKRKNTSKFHNPHGFDQFLILQDKSNKIKVIKSI